MLIRKKGWLRKRGMLNMKDSKAAYIAADYIAFIYWCERDKALDEDLHREKRIVFPAKMGGNS